MEIYEPVSASFRENYCDNCGFAEHCFIKTEDCKDFIQKAVKPFTPEEKLGWVSVLDTDKLPPIGTWVAVLQDKSGYTQGDILPSGEPNYWFSSDYYFSKMRNEWMKKVSAASLRSISEDGWPDWEQGRLASGRALTYVEYVTHWQPLPSLPGETNEKDT